MYLIFIQDAILSFVQLSASIQTFDVRGLANQHLGFLSSDTLANSLSCRSFISFPLGCPMCITLYFHRSSEK